MRSHTKAFVFLAVVTISGMAGAETMQPLDFVGWDPAVLSSDGGSQLFEDILEGVDVTVTAMGEFDETGRYLPTIEGGIPEIASSHQPGVGSSSSHTYSFEFSSPQDVAVETRSLDGQEQYIIKSDGTAGSYVNLVGASPEITREDNMVILDGVGLGQDPDEGASNGQTFLRGVTSLMVTYNGDPTTVAKFGSFRLISVPEPNSLVLLMVGALGLIRRQRRR